MTTNRCPSAEGDADGDGRQLEVGEQPFLNFLAAPLRAGGKCPGRERGQRSQPSEQEADPHTMTPGDQCHCQPVGYDAAHGRTGAPAAMLTAIVSSSTAAPM